MAEEFEESCRDMGMRYMVKIGEGPKNEKVYLRNIKMKKIMIFSCEISDTGSETMLQK